MGEINARVTVISMTSVGGRPPLGRCQEGVSAFGIVGLINQIPIYGTAGLAAALSRVMPPADDK
jgi:hypothetical protein